jgi:hypothetical protein
MTDSKNFYIAITFDAGIDNLTILGIDTFIKFKPLNVKLYGYIYQDRLGKNYFTSEQPSERGKINYKIVSYQLKND